MTTRNSSPRTVGAEIQACAARLDQAGVWFGHGTDNAIDEAAALVLFAAGLEHGQPGLYEQTLSPAALARLDDYLRQRIDLRRPTPYITGEAWFAGLRFRVDERVLIPRSPFAELILEGFEPWLRPGPVKRLLEIGTGSGCIAIALCHVFPAAQVVATDICADALAVARDNRSRHGLDGQLALLRADLLSGLRGPFDLIVTNPPYVPLTERDSLPAEYAHEPEQALYSAENGLASARRILQDAASRLAPDGLLAMEVGAGWQALEAAYPGLPLVWPEFEAGGEGVALIDAAALRDHLNVQ